MTRTTFTRFHTQKIFQNSLASIYFENDKGVSIENFLQIYNGIKKTFNDDINVLFRFCSEETKRLFLENSNINSNKFPKIDKNQSKLIFDSIYSYLEEVDSNNIEKNFEKIIQNSTTFKQDFFLKTIPYLIGNRVIDLVNLGVYISSKRNKYRIIDSLSEEDIEKLPGGLERLIFPVKTHPSIQTSKFIAKNYLESCKIGLNKGSKDDIKFIDIKNYNDISGSFDIEVIYKPKKRVLPNPFVICFKDKIKKRINKIHKNISFKQDFINLQIYNYHSKEYEAINGMLINDLDTAQHQERQVLLGSFFAKLLGVNDTILRHYVMGILNHDNGKIAIPDEILQFRGKYSPIQRKCMEFHSIFGTFQGAYKAKQSIDINTLDSKLVFLDEKEVVESIRLRYEHQERADGSGYPFGFTKNEISPQGLISQVIDVYDALRFPRIYKNGLENNEILDIMNTMGFDPLLFDFFKKNFIPILDEWKYGPDSWDYHSTSKANSGVEAEIVGFIAGNNNNYYVSNEVEKNFLNSHKGLDLTLDKLLFISAKKAVHELNEIEKSNEKDMLLTKIRKYIPVIENYSNLQVMN